MATQKQIEANRRNAQKSTGAKSVEGKAAVSQNRFKHGLCGMRFAVMPGESQQEYETLLNDLMRAEAPADAAEVQLVIKMAQHTWYSQRGSLLQNGCFESEATTGTHQARVTVRKDLDVYTRYQAHHDRCYQRASAELQKRKKERRLAEIGFEREKRAQAKEKRDEAKEIRAIAKHEVQLTSAQQVAEGRQMDNFVKAAAAAKVVGPLFDPSDGQFAA